MYFLLYNTCTSQIDVVQGVGPKLLGIFKRVPGSTVLQHVQLFEANLAAAVSIAVRKYSVAMGQSLNTVYQLNISTVECYE
jgi:hypothetical protein